MTCSRFTKQKFKRTVINRLRRLFMREGETATQEQLFRAVSDTVMDVIAEDWMYTKNAVREQDQRTVYYLSMEFLVGRALGNALVPCTIKIS